MNRRAVTRALLLRGWWWSRRRSVGRRGRSLGWWSAGPRSRDDGVGARRLVDRGLVAGVDGAVGRCEMGRACVVPRGGVDREGDGLGWFAAAEPEPKCRTRGGVGGHDLKLRGRDGRDHQVLSLGEVIGIGEIIGRHDGGNRDTKALRDGSQRVSGLHLVEVRRGRRRRRHHGGGYRPRPVEAVTGGIAEQRVERLPRCGPTPISAGDGERDALAVDGPGDARMLGSAVDLTAGAAASLAGLDPQQRPALNQRARRPRAGVQITRRHRYPIAAQRRGGRNQRRGARVSLDREPRRRARPRAATPDYHDRQQRGERTPHHSPYPSPSAQCRLDLRRIQGGASAGLLGAFRSVHGAGPRIEPITPLRPTRSDSAFRTVSVEHCMDATREWPIWRRLRPRVRSAGQPTSTAVTLPWSTVALMRFERISIVTGSGTPSRRTTRNAHSRSSATARAGLFVEPDQSRRDRLR